MNLKIKLLKIFGDKLNFAFICGSYLKEKNTSIYDIDLSRNDSSYILIREDGNVVTLSTNSFEYVYLGNILKNNQFWEDPRINKAGHLHLWTDESYF